ncbi:MAG: FliM/FliN family flagellar motor switch protein [Chlamydiia bacterium]|nr:FliM/FliN family flagellar motor switch protein [Chlamydiia bacterium]
MSDFPIRLRVVLAKEQISKEDLQRLEVGDVLLFNQRVNNFVEIEIERIRKWKGTPGYIGANKGVLIDG